MNTKLNKAKIAQLTTAICLAAGVAGTAKAFEYSIEDPGTSVNSTGTGGSFPFYYGTANGVE